MTASIGISIINYRTPALTIACLQSVLCDEVDRPVEIVVIDNASGDGSADEIEAWIARQTSDIPMTLVRSQTNSGFSGGHNQVMAQLDCDWYLLLNSDATLKPGFMAALGSVIGEDPQVGLIAPQIADSSGTVQMSTFRYHSPISELTRAAQIGPLGRILSKYDVCVDPDAAPSDIEWVSFACILLRAEMVEQIGAMDEGYFLYYEDSEYCLRARRAGWKIRYHSQAHVLHDEGGSGDVVDALRARDRAPAYYYASRTRFLYQAYGYAGLIAANLLWGLGRLLARLRLLLGQPVPQSAAHEARDTWTNISKPLGPRYAPWEK